jgi:hypothetical protein
MLELLSVLPVPIVIFLSCGILSFLVKERENRLKIADLKEAFKEIAGVEYQGH